MSALILVQFLQNQAAKNEKLQSLMKIAAQKIEQNEHLKRRQKELQKQHFMLTRQVFILGIILDQLKENEQQRQLDNERAKSAYSMAVEARLQFEQLKLSSLMLNEYKVKELEMNMALQSLLETVEQKDKQYTEMENRKIVMELRKRQLEKERLKEEIKVQKENFDKQKMDIYAQMANADRERNDLIIEFVKLIMELQKKKETTSQPKFELNVKQTISKPTKPFVADMQKLLRTPGAQFSMLQTLEIATGRSPGFFEQIIAECLKRNEELMHSTTETPNDSTEIANNLSSKIAVTSPNTEKKNVDFMGSDNNTSDSAESVEEAAELTSEDVVENDEAIVENYIEPAQTINPTTIDLVTPMNTENAKRVNKSNKRIEKPKQNKSKPTQVVLLEESYENIENLVDDSNNYSDEADEADDADEADEVDEADENDTSTNNKSLFNFNDIDFEKHNFGFIFGEDKAKKQKPSTSKTAAQPQEVADISLNFSIDDFCRSDDDSNSIKCDAFTDF